MYRHEIYKLSIFILINKIMNEILKYNMSCIVEKAYSMGFVILQVCKIRYILPFGKIMLHQISFRIQNEKGKVEN